MRGGGVGCSLFTPDASPDYHDGPAGVSNFWQPKTSPNTPILPVFLRLPARRGSPILANVGDLLMAASLDLFERRMWPAVSGVLNRGNCPVFAGPRSRGCSLEAGEVDKTPKVNPARTI